MSHSAVATKKVLVIGYGTAGSQFAAFAAKNKSWSVTVLSPFDYHEISLCMTKAIAVGSEEHTKAIYPLLREPGVEYILESASSLTNGSATTTSGKVIDFDLCVVATGQRIPLFYPSPEETTKDLRIKTVAAVTSNIQRSNNIVISGAGPVGSELAADIKLRNKGKKITLITPHGNVLTMMRQPLPELATKHLKEIDIDVITNDRVESHEHGEVVLASGKRVPCDLYIPAHSTGGNATFLPAASQDARGYAMVDDTFLVHGFNNVFAVGDCSNYDKIKTYPKIDDQMPVLQFNAKAALAGTQLKHHVKGASMPGGFDGPLMVAFGHGLDEGWGVGPDCPGFCGVFCWACCCFGYPCSPPVGHMAAKGKSDFNFSIKPKPGVGVHS